MLQHAAISFKDNSGMPNENQQIAAVKKFAIIIHTTIFVKSVQIKNFGSKIKSFRNCPLYIRLNI